MTNFKNKRNPVLPLEYHIPDSEAHVMPDGRLYIYGSYDDREDVFCSEKYYVVSTNDMESWTIHDISLTGAQIPWFNNPDAPKYQGIDWSHPIPFDECDPASWNNHGSIECVNGQWYVFYHRCSRGVQQHRRLCIEPITINADGSINEVKMTSQGVGLPFAPNEKIMGYQACGVKGSCYIGLDNTDSDYTEKLMNISVKDEAVFRYIKSGKDWSSINITYAGSGKIKVLLIDSQNADCQIEAGTVFMPDAGTGIHTINGEIYASAGEYEIVLVFEESDGLEIFEISLQ